MLVGSATVLNSLPIFSFRHVKGSSTWECGVALIGSWTTRMSLLHHVCHHLSPSNIIALELRVRSAISAPTKAIMDLMTSTHFSWFNHDHHGQILAFCSLRVLHVPTVTPENKYKEHPVMPFLMSLRGPAQCEGGQKLSCSNGDTNKEKYCSTGDWRKRNWTLITKDLEQDLLLDSFDVLICCNL